MAREEGITILKGTDLKYLLIDALKSYSEDVQFKMITLKKINTTTDSICIRSNC